MKISKGTIIQFSPGEVDRKIACLTLDLEQDYGDLLGKPSYEGLQYLPLLISELRALSVPLTVFVQGSLLESHPHCVEKLNVLDVEYELHAYTHLPYTKTSTQYEVERGLEAYWRFFCKKPLGYRFPSGIFKEGDYSILKQAGFRFDSSVFPSFRVNAFNNLTMPVYPYYLKNYDIVEIPFSVFSRFIRIPVSLSYIKLLGLIGTGLIRLSVLPDILVFNFHLHDLFPLKDSETIIKRSTSFLEKFVLMRAYKIKKNNDLNLLVYLINTVKNHSYQFCKMEAVYDYLKNQIREVVYAGPGKD